MLGKGRTPLLRVALLLLAFAALLTTTPGTSSPRAYAAVAATTPHAVVAAEGGEGGGWLAARRAAMGDAGELNPWGFMGGKAGYLPGEGSFPYVPLGGKGLPVRLKGGQTPA